MISEQGNKKAGELHHSDLNVTSVFCQRVGKLCRRCLQQADLAEGSSDPPEASQVGSSSLCRAATAFLLLFGSVWVAEGSAGTDWPLSSLLAAGDGGDPAPVPGEGNGL